MRIEYIYKRDEIINVITLTASQNKKLGWFKNVLGTYHFSPEQLEGGIEKDSKSCLDCPLSYTSGNGKCYTHKGLQRLGLLSMLKRLRKLSIEDWNVDSFNKFTDQLKSFNIDLFRAGIYGEPIYLSIDEIQQLKALSKNMTGYTHQWSKPEFNEYSNFLMASTHSIFETNLANGLGWRSFNVGIIEGVNCPASKEAGKRTTCASCGLCNGSTGNSSKNIYIKQH